MSTQKQLIAEAYKKVNSILSKDVIISEEKQFQIKDVKQRKTMAAYTQVVNEDANFTDTTIKFIDSTSKKEKDPIKIETLESIKSFVTQNGFITPPMQSFLNSYSQISEDVEDGIKYTVKFLGGSIGQSIQSLRQIKDKTVSDSVTVYDTYEEAKNSAKEANKRLSPGEKKYYGIKAVVAEVKDGKFTGK